MDESKILSTEEVDALLKAAQEKDSDLSKLVKSTSLKDESEASLNYKMIANIVELTWAECEKIYSSFIRKKVIVKHKDSRFGKLSDCLEGKMEKHVYSVFRITTTNDYCLVLIALPFLHQMINALYGGVINAQEKIMEAPGNIGIIVAEKICELALDGFCQACKEYGKVAYERVKTVTLPNLISKLSMDDDIYLLSYVTILGEAESEITFMFPVDFLHKFLPASDIKDEEQMRKNHAWRVAIENQVVDSNITIIASLPEINLKTKDIMSLKDGDLIPIDDPTMVDIYLNDVKLFRASAAQANSKRIIKILGEN